MFKSTNKNKCESPTSAAVDSIDVPMIIDTHSIFEDDDVEISTDTTENNLDIKKTAGNAIESTYLIYPEEDEVTYMVPVPKNGTPKDSSLTPITIMVVDTIGLKKSRVLLKVLLDPGSTKTLISRKALPRGTSPIPLQQAKMVTTLAGTMKAAEMVHLRDLRLPEFDKNRRIDEQKALVFENKCRYDVILGSDFLTKSGIDIKYSDGTMNWFENVRPMREPWALDNKEYVAMADSISIQQEDEQFGEDWLDSYLTKLFWMQNMRR